VTIKNIVAQHEVVQWEEGMETTVLNNNKKFNTGFSGK
jgi:hypothetical protein